MFKTTRGRNSTSPRSIPECQGLAATGNDVDPPFACMGRSGDHECRIMIKELPLGTSVGQRSEAKSAGRLRINGRYTFSLWLLKSSKHSCKCSRDGRPYRTNLWGVRRSTLR